VTVARRDTGEKQQIPLPRVTGAIGQLLRDIQVSLFQAASDERERRTLRDPRDYGEMIAYLREAKGLVAASWCGRGECEARVKGDTSATIRCLPFDSERVAGGACICCGRPAVTPAIWAQAY
jgi:prolyl-tRNA synthetase